MQFTENSQNEYLKFVFLRYPSGYSTSIEMICVSDMSSIFNSLNLVENSELVQYMTTIPIVR
jgi:hypothetical protein